MIYASPVRRVRWFIHSFVHSIGLFASTLALPSASSPQACIVAVLLLLLLLLKPKSIWCRNEANRRHRPKTQTTRACVQSLGALVRRPSKTSYEQKTKNAYNILVIQLWQTIWGFGCGFGPMHIYIRCWSLCAIQEYIRSLSLLQLIDATIILSAVKTFSKTSINRATVLHVLTVASASINAMQCKWARRHEISDDRPKMLILTFWSRDFGVCVTVLGGKFVANNQKKRWQARWAATQNHTPTTAAAAHASIHTLWWSLWIRNQFPSIHFDAVWFVKFAHAIKCLANLSVFFFYYNFQSHWTLDNAETKNRRK